MAIDNSAIEIGARVRYHATCDKFRYGVLKKRCQQKRRGLVQVAYKRLEWVHLKHLECAPERAHPDIPPDDADIDDAWYESDLDSDAPDVETTCDYDHDHDHSHDQDDDHDHDDHDDDHDYDSATSPGCGAALSPIAAYGPYTHTRPCAPPPPPPPPPPLQNKSKNVAKVVDKRWGCSKCRYRGTKQCVEKDGVWLRPSCKPKPSGSQPAPPTRNPGPATSLTDADPPARPVGTSTSTSTTSSSSSSSSSRSSATAATTTAADPVGRNIADARKSMSDDELTTETAMQRKACLEDLRSDRIPFLAGKRGMPFQPIPPIDLEFIGALPHQTPHAALVAFVLKHMPQTEERCHKRLAAVLFVVCSALANTVPYTGLKNYLEWAQKQSDMQFFTNMCSKVFFLRFQEEDDKGKNVINEFVVRCHELSKQLGLAVSNA